MKRKLLLSILAMVPALFLPLAAHSQLNSDDTTDTTPAAQAEPSYKYEVFAGWGYTSLNQVNQSRYGLQGVDITVTRDWGKYFGITADGAFYSTPLESTDNPNPCCNASVDSVLLGPVFHGHLFGRTSGFFRVLLGAEHTGGQFNGVDATPNLSFAGGVGGGMDYRLSRRFSLRASGDDIASSFSANASSTTCSASSDCSAHMRRNSRAAVGLVYRF